MQRRLKIPQQVIIVTHTFFYGASEALRDYLVSKKIQTLIYIGHPLLSGNSSYTTKRFNGGKQTFEYTVQRKFVASFLALIRDVMVTVQACLVLSKNKYLYVGVNPLNACVGIFLRSMGIVDRVIFYAIDFVPLRSKWRIINTLYHTLEAFAVRYADICWNVSPRIAEGRSTFLGIENKSQVVVPIGVWKKNIVVKVKSTNDYRLIFVGHLLKKQGLQEVICALPSIIKKLPRVSLTIIGGGEYDQTLRDLVIELSLDKYVKLLGWESNQQVIQKYIMKSDLALATYDTVGKDTTNFSYYADPTKIKTYLSCGVPVLMTDVSYNAKFLMKSGVAVVVPYETHVIASAVIRLFTHTNTLYKMKEQTIREAHKFRWDVIYNKAFSFI